MNILTIENLTHSYSERKLFDDTSFSLEEGEKVGIIGINGTGKSTLLNIIAGNIVPDEGKVTIANKVIIEMLSQHPSFDDNETVIHYVMTDVPKDEDMFAVEAEAKAMLQTFGLTDYDELTCHMSGGQRKKIALVRTLLSGADILILDEPTNHLDNEMSTWLENYLKDYKKSVIMVTHDRYFLDSVSDRIVELDKGKIYSYNTNYSGFLELKAEREEMAVSTDSKKANLLRNELKWVMRGAKARSTKQKARLMRYEELKNRKRPEQDSEIELSSISTRLGRTTVEINNLSKAYGDRHIINDFNYIFLKNDRIGIVGPNGCGKTTLLKLIMGIVEPDEGKIVIGQTVKIGYYAQEISTRKEDGISFMDPEIRVIDYIKNTAEYVKTRDGSLSASQMLDKFLFPPREQYSLIKKLSGGEKRRLNLLRVLMEAPNVLILDEPTNDLDIKTLTILEDYLDSFDGIVIAVSHDRYFLDRVVRRIFAFENGRLRQYEGGYSDYELVAEFDKEPVKADPGIPKNTGKKVKQEKLKFTYAEQKEFEHIEDDIGKIEARITEIDNLMVKNSNDFVKLNELDCEKNKLNEELEYKMERWEYLTELDERIKNR
ncbi:ABC-F family ATP-binding cassette domain-containing protein [Eshraghiella crossota]